MFSFLNSRTDAVRTEIPYLQFFNPDLGKDEILFLPYTTRKKLVTSPVWTENSKSCLAPA